MKRKTTYFYKILAAILLIAFVQEAGAQKVDKEIGRTYQLAGNADLVIQNYNCDLEIHTWKEQQVKVHMKVIATMVDVEDAEILSDFLDELEFKKNGSGITINTRFWESRSSRGNRPTTMELTDGQEVKYRNFKVSAELWIPEDVSLDLNSKYSIINMEDLAGKAKMNLYNDKVYARSVGGPLKINSKYSNFEFTELQELDAYFYSGEFEAASSTSTKIESKYSKIAITNTGGLELDSYSDKFRFASTGNIQFNNKYSDLDAGKTGNIVVNGYNTTLNVAGAGNVKLDSKYGNYELGKALVMEISSSYSEKVTVKDLGSLEITNSKYGNYRIEQISGKISLANGYSDKIHAEKCLTDFQGMKLNGKYLVADLTIDPAMPFSLSANLKYPDINIPEDWLEIRKEIKDGSQLEMEARKGSPTESDAKLDIRGYNVKLTLK